MTVKNTKENLITCACNIFAQKGYHNTTIAEISEKAGANIAAVNYHFSSKAHLYQSVIIHAIKIANRYFPLDSGITENSSPEKKLYSFIKGIVSRSIGNEPQHSLKKILVFEMINPTEESGTLVADYINETRTFLLNIIKDLTDADNRYFYFVYSIMSQCLLFSYAEKGREKNFDPSLNALISVDELTKHIYTFSLSGIRQFSHPLENS